MRLPIKFWSILKKILLIFQANFENTALELAERIQNKHGYFVVNLIFQYRKYVDRQACPIFHTSDILTYTFWNDATFWDAAIFNLQNTKLFK